MSAQHNQGEQPFLSSGIIFFNDAAQFLDAYGKTLGRGALTVTSTDEIEPLTPFDIEIIVSGTDERFMAQAQVVSSREGVMLLSLIDHEERAAGELEAMAQRLQEFAADIEEEELQDQAVVAEPTVAAEPAAAAVPAPIEGFFLDPPAIPAAAVEPTPPPAPEPAPSPAEEPAPPPPAAEQPQQAEPAPSVSPPVLSDGSLVFADTAAVTPALDEVERTGGLMTQAIGKLPDYGALTLKVQLSDGTSAGAVGAEVVFAQAEQAALMFPDKGVALAALRQIGPATPPSPAIQSVTSALGDAPAASAGGASSGLTLPRCPMRNPDSPPALLELNLAQPPDPRQKDRHNLLELIFGLARLRALGTLTITHEDGELEIPFKSGILLINDEDRERILSATLMSDGHVEMRPALPAKLGADRRPRDPRGVVGDCLRRALREQRSLDLEIALGSRMELFPVATEGATPMVFGLKLEQKEARFLDLVLDGTRPLKEIPRVAGMLRPTTFRLIYILLAYRLIAFNEDATFDPSEDPKKLFTAECERLLNADPFELLGVHWSEHPDLIRERYERRRERYATVSPMAKHNPPLASEVYNAMERAHHKLQERESRKAARKALGDIDIRGAAHILMKHGELASLRGDLRTVKQCFEMAMELYPTKEYQQQMATLLKG